MKDHCLQYRCSVLSTYFTLIFTEPFDVCLFVLKYTEKTVLLCNKNKQLHHAVLHPCENKNEVATSEQGPAVQGISLLKLSYSKKVVSAQMKAKSVQLGKMQIVSFTEKFPFFRRFWGFFFIF